MPWTTHGYWTGLREPTYPGPPRLDCGGPHRCTQCALEAHRLEEAETAMPTAADNEFAVVHYVTYGTPGGEYTSECRPAIMTGLQPAGAPDDVAALAIFYPTGLSFNPTVAHHDGTGDPGNPDCPLRDQHRDGPFRFCACGWTEDAFRGGTWHRASEH